MLNCLVLLGLLGIVLRAMPVAAAPCRVPSSAYPTIQAAVNDPTCATINVAAGTYVEHVTIGRDVTLRGDGQDVTVVDGSGSGQVFVISQGTVTITGVTIQHGNAGFDSGGGILNFGAGTLTVANSTLTANTAGEGGGLFNGGTLTVANSTLTANAAGEGGGLFNGGTLTVMNSTLAANAAASAAASSTRAR
jgi:nitrous oxidase accessory protein NosD